MYKFMPSSEFSIWFQPWTRGDRGYSEGDKHGQTLSSPGQTLPSSGQIVSSPEQTLSSAGQIPDNHGQVVCETGQTNAGQIHQFFILQVIIYIDFAKNYFEF